MVKERTIEETFVKTNLHEHTLNRPDSYLGSIKNISEEKWIAHHNNSKVTFIKKIINFNPGLMKIIDEILVNSIDNTTRDPTCNVIKVNIENNIIKIFNNGDNGIPVAIHKQHNVYVPELIFGNLLTSSNYNDNEKRIVGGLNGLGAKLCNIFSKQFTVDIVDNNAKLHYYQKFSNNMYDKSEPLIKKSTKKSYTCIEFLPDYSKFKMNGLTKDIISLIEKRVYDCTACTNKNVKVYFNDELLKQKDFQHYIELFETSEKQQKIVYEKIESGDFIWEYAVKLNNTYEQVSFVNGVSTKGGKHVDHVINQITKKFLELLKSKKKIENIKPNYIKDRLFIFLRATIDKPNFGGQTKDYLETPVKDFGINIAVSDAFINKLYKTDLVDEIISFTNFKNNKELDKTTDKKKTSNIKVDKLDDANNAGTKKSLDCTLILTEGDSAKAFAISGLSIVGRDNYGVFPLRGKLLNVREAKQSQLVSNAEINNIKKILGLQHNKKYTEDNINELRYGSILILTDSDQDGSHIKCLLVNMFHIWWPELLEIKGFLRNMKTPIVKTTIGKKITNFYTIQDFKEWEKDNKTSNINAKYYKGLGTSTAAEAKEIFKDLNKNIINYISDDINQTNNAIELAFDKKKADDRKTWLQNYNYNILHDQSDKDISFSDLINKELIHYSMYDVFRSIPSICDGFKPSQRKVIFTMFKKKYTKEIKVAQLGASVAETSGYHHGEQSLFETIIKMAQDYPGSNNLNLLKPNGQFGTRLQNGKDSASPRYIFTELNDITKILFNENDFNILENQEEESLKIEPKFYVPILPIILINGSIGIGTGYSTNIPCFNPTDIINNMKTYIKDKKMNKMTPWYRGFNGTIIQDSTNKTKFIMKGTYKQNGKLLEITEIPLGVSIEKYKEIIENLIECNDYILSYKNNSTENTPHFTLKFSTEKILDKFIMSSGFLKTMHLTETINTTNFHLINNNGTITKYNSAEDILKEFINIRLIFNVKRKEYLINKYNDELLILKNKIKFLEMIMNNEIVVYRKTKLEIEKILDGLDFHKIENNYNYLISLPIYSFTKEKIENLSNKFVEVNNALQSIQSKNAKTILLEDLENLKI